jgi:hypothetical protein
MSGRLIISRMLLSNASTACLFVMEASSQIIREADCRSLAVPLCLVKIQNPTVINTQRYLKPCHSDGNFYISPNVCRNTSRPREARSWAGTLMDSFVALFAVLFSIFWVLFFMGFHCFLDLPFAGFSSSLEVGTICSHSYTER